jgi:probable HAF family extracellular repeat protein
MLAAAMVATATQYSFTTLAPPGFTNPVAGGINDAGDIVGFGLLNNVPTSFLYSGGVFTGISVPSSTGTVASGINNSGQIAGSFNTAVVSGAFSYKAGTFAILQPPFGPTYAGGTGINNAGQIVGFFSSPSVLEGGFLYSSASFLEIFGDGLSTRPAGINDSGQIVGNVDGPVSGERPFLYSNGVFTYFGNAPNEGATAINNVGQILVDRSGASGPISYLDDNGVFSPFAFPGALGTDALGINDEGQIVGYYLDASSQQQAFLATPALIPEPSSGTLPLLAAAGFVCFALRRKATKNVG